MSDPSPRNSTVITERNYHHSNQTIHSRSFLVGKKKQSAISTEIPCTASEIPLWLNQTIYCMIIDSSIDSSPIDPNHPTSSDPQPIDRQHKTALTIDIQARELESGSPHHHRSNPSHRHHYPLVAMQNSTTTSSPTAVETISATSGSNNSSANTTGNNNNNSNHHANSNSNKHNDAATPFTSTALLDSSMPSYWSTAGDDNAATGPTASAAVINPTITSNQHSRHNSNSSNHGSGSSSSNSNPNHNHHHHHNSNNNNTNHAFPYTATPPSSSSLNNPAHLTQFSPLVVSQHQQQHNHRRVPPGQRRKPFPPSVVNAIGSMQNKNITTNPISGNWNHAGNASPTWKLQNWQQQQQRNSNGGHPPPGAPPPLLNTANSNHRTRSANMPSLARSHRNRSPFSVGRAPIANYDSKSDEAAASTYVPNPSSGKAFSVAELNSALNTVRTKSADMKFPTLENNLMGIIESPTPDEHTRDKTFFPTNQGIDRGLEDPTAINDQRISPIRPLHLMDNNVRGGGGDHTERFSRKVFVGGLPPDIDEDEIHNSFCRFGPLTVDWPHKAESKSYFPPKGYAFLLFEEEVSVQKLIESCVRDDDKLFMYVSSPTIKHKPVQIRPWNLSDSDFVMDNSKPLDPRKTIFVGGVPRPLRACELAKIMNDFYGGVCYAGIDTDPELKYPKGAGRVAFSNQQSYIAAISARFVQLQHGDIDKRVEVKPYVLDDQMCDHCQGARCGGKFAPFFCSNVTCLQYYCEHCWAMNHSRQGKEFHKPLVKEGGDRPRTVPFRWS